MRRNDDGTWSQMISGLITNGFAKNGTLKSPFEKITDANLSRAFLYARYDGAVLHTENTQS